MYRKTKTTSDVSTTEPEVIKVIQIPGGLGSVKFIKAAKDLVRWQLVGKNGEIMCTGESHRDLTDVKRAIRRCAEVLTQLCSQCL